MSTHIVAYEAYDAFQNAVPNTTDEVSLDGGQTYRELQGKETSDGFEIADGSKFVARVSTRGMWPVTQPLVIQDDDHLDFDGDRDFGAAPLFSHSIGQPGRWRHVLHASLTLFRDGGPDRKAHGCPDVPSFTHDVLTFRGPPVFDATGTGLARFAAEIQPSVPSFGANGALLFLKTVPNAALHALGEDVRVPELTAVFVPVGLELDKPISMHLFFTPYTTPKIGDYPYGIGHDSFSEMTDNYLVSGGKRLLQQRSASKKQVVFVFPLAPREAQFRGILPARRTRLFLLEIAYFIRRHVGGVRFPFATPQLGLCSASCFSSGADPWLHLLGSSIDEGAFPEFKEAYSLDGFPGKERSHWDDMSEIVEAWWKMGRSGRRLRMYGHYSHYEDPSQRPPFARMPTVTFALPNGGKCLATESPLATFAWTPQGFWEGVVAEMTDGGSYFSVDPAIGRPSLYPASANGEARDKIIHQLMPSFFLEHALTNSAHPDAGA